MFLFLTCTVAILDSKPYSTLNKEKKDIYWYLKFADREKYKKGLCVCACQHSVALLTDCWDNKKEERLLMLLFCKTASNSTEFDSERKKTGDWDLFLSPDQTARSITPVHNSCRGSLLRTCVSLASRDDSPSLGWATSTTEFISPGRRVRVRELPSGQETSSTVALSVPGRRG